jgi:hypothetical protein
MVTQSQLMSDAAMKQAVPDPLANLSAYLGNLGGINKSGQSADMQAPVTNNPMTIAAGSAMPEGFNPNDWRPMQQNPNSPVANLTTNSMVDPRTYSAWMNSYTPPAAAPVNPTPTAGAPMPSGQFETPVPPVVDQTGQPVNSTPVTAPATPTTGTAGTPATMQDLIGQYVQRMNDANTANENRYNQGLGLYDAIVQAYMPGGGYGAGAMKSYQQGKQQSMSQAMQSAVDAGLAGTTVPSGFGTKYEQEVGTPFRLNLADLQMGKLTDALANMAGFVERRTDQAPSSAELANLVQTASSAGGETGAGGGTGTGGGSGTSGGTGTGGSSGSGTYTSPEGLWYSGTVEPISNQQYTAEQKRIQKLNAAARQSDSLTKKIKQQEEKLAALPADSSKREKVQEKLTQYQTELEAAQEQADKYSHSNAQISSASFAYEQQRLANLRQQATAAEQALYQQRLGVQQQADLSQAARNSASIAGAGWGTWNF